MIGLFVFTGCATIVDGRPDTVHLMTNTGQRAQAQVTTRAGTQTVILPSQITAQKSCRDIIVQIEDDKHQMSMAQVSSSTNWWILGNIALGGLIGLAVDGMTGAICTYPSTAFVNVVPK